MNRTPWSASIGPYKASQRPCIPTTEVGRAETRAWFERWERLSVCIHTDTRNASHPLPEWATFCLTWQGVTYPMSEETAAAACDYFANAGNTSNGRVTELRKFLERIEEMRADGWDVVTNENERTRPGFPRPGV